MLILTLFIMTAHGYVSFPLLTFPTIEACRAASVDVKYQGEQIPEMPDAAINAINPLSKGWKCV